MTRRIRSPPIPRLSRIRHLASVGGRDPDSERKREHVQHSCRTTGEIGKRDRSGIQPFTQFVAFLTRDFEIKHEVLDVQS